jgi:hypothetical protein
VHQVSEVAVEVANDVDRGGKLKKSRIVKERRFADAAKDRELGVVEIKTVLRTNVVSMLHDVLMKASDSRISDLRLRLNGSWSWSGKGHGRRQSSGCIRGGFVVAPARA